MKRDRDPDDAPPPEEPTAKRANQEQEDDAEYAAVRAKYPSLSASSWSFFKTHVLVRPADWSQPHEWGFKDERLDVLSKEQRVGSVWHYFGNHGCFIGGEPPSETYEGSRLVDDATTPFERLYYVYRGTKECPLVVCRLREDVLMAGPIAEHKQKRVFDAMELLDWTRGMGDEVFLYSRHKEDDTRTCECPAHSLWAKLCANGLALTALAPPTDETRARYHRVRRAAGYDVEE
jgi:hypothetical protein